MNTNININIHVNILQKDSIFTLTIEQFLKDLDKKYDVRIFTKYLNSFKKLEVDILDIINFKDNGVVDFLILLVYWIKWNVT